MHTSAQCGCLEDGGFTRLSPIHKGPHPPWSTVAADPTLPGTTTAKSTRPHKRRKRTNTSQKGTAVELTAIKMLEADGYKVHRCVRTGIKRGSMYISQSNDVFGCIDLVAKKRGQRTRWIQVTADGGIGRKKADLEEVPWDPLFDEVEIWRWVGGRARKHKVTGEWLDRQYFQVYRLDEDYELRPENKVRPSEGSEVVP